MKTTIVSTSKLQTHKISSISIILVLYLALIGAFVTNLIRRSRIFESSGLIALWSYIALKAVQISLKLKTISYDDSSVYYEKDGFEVQIPFEEIRDIEIKTLTGVYVINLFRPAQDGVRILFKMSNWYPLNYKKQDEIVNRLRDKIERYKRSFLVLTAEELPGRRI